MAPFSPDRPVEDSYANRPTRERPGQGAEQLCVSGGSLPRIGSHALLFRRVSVCTTIRDARRSALALGRQNCLPPKKSARPQLAVCAIKPSAPGISDSRLWPEHDEEGDRPGKRTK
jgi:hypothetical protein